MNCILCSGSEFRRIYADERLVVVRCMSCGLACQEDYRETLSKLDNTFENVDCYYQMRGKTADLSGSTPNPRKLTLTSDIRSEILRRTRPDGAVLDVGCGRGEFLLELRRAGLRATGVEPNQVLAMSLAEREGIPVIAQMYGSSLFPADSFDAITFIQVLEHLEDPLRTLRAAHAHLRPGGLLVIDVPSLDNPRILAYRATGWKRLVRRDFIPPHSFYYTRATLSRLVEKAGFLVAKAETGRYGVKSGKDGTVIRLVDSAANHLGIGGITLYALRPDAGADEPND